MDYKEKQLSATYLFRGKIVKTRVDQAEMPDGQVFEREVVEHPGGVGIAMENEEGKFFMVTQWRYAHDCVTIEFPAGKREPGEEDLSTAKREIIEETGYEGDDFRYLGTMMPTPAYDTETIGMYYARKGTFRGQNLDVDENLNLSFMSLDEITDAIVSGEIQDAKTIAMTFLVKEMKQREGNAK